MPLQPESTHVYVAGVQNPYTAELAEAKALYDREIDSTDGWEEFGDDVDTRLEKKVNPDGSQGSLPIVRGSALIRGATTDQIVPILQTPGIRRKWDPRFETAWILRRFSSTAYEFYSLGNSPPGLGWIINPRDILGISQIYNDGSESDATFGQNKPITLIQTSIKDDERAPDQPKKTRMALSLSGWKIVPKGNDVEVTYIVKVNLGGKIPSNLMAGVIQDIPICAGKVKNTYEKFGYPPYILHKSTDPSQRTIEQTTIFHLGATKKDVHQPLKNDKHWHGHFTGTANGDFTIIYDTKTMYAKEGGLHFAVRGAGADGVNLTDDGNGRIEVHVGEGAQGKDFEIVLAPHGSSSHITKP